MLRPLDEYAAKRGHKDNEISLATDVQSALRGVVDMFFNDSRFREVHFLPGCALCGDALLPSI
ncbi:hypothetical protein D3C85_1516280 [compost metagenome]